MRGSPARDGVKGARVRAGEAPRGFRQGPRPGSRDDPRRGERFAALLFYALPAALAVWGAAVYLATSGAVGTFANPAYKVFVLMLPFLALLGVAGAWTLRRAWTLGSAAGLAVGALLATRTPGLGFFYFLSAAMMYLTSRKLE